MPDIKTRRGLNPLPTLEEAQRKHRSATVLMRASVFVLVVSWVALVGCMRSEWAGFVVFLMWNHLAVMIVIGWGSFGARRLPRTVPGRALPSFGKLFAPWILVIAAASMALVVFEWAPFGLDLGTMPDGGNRIGLSVYRSVDGTQFYKSIDRGPGQEITEREYDEIERGVFAFFACIWTAFSLVALLIWRFIVLRWETEMERGMNPQAQAVTQAPRAAASWKSTAVILGIWGVMIGGNALNFTRGAVVRACAAKMMTPSWMPVVLCVFPALFFGGWALMAKRTPFLSPLIEDLLNQRLGIGGAQDFMRRLKPLMLFAIGGLASAAAMIISCPHENNAGGLVMPGFLLSGSVGFALAHVILRWRKIPGV